MVSSRSRKYEYWLLLFLGLFVFRVLAQLIQRFSPVEFLPSFDSWQSGAIPYLLLLLLQIIIIAFQCHILLQLHQGKLVENHKFGIICLGVGSVYFLGMYFRLVAGYSFASEHAWLGAHLPAFFHLVLASFLLCIGFYHAKATDQIIAWLAYPFIVLSALIFHLLALSNGMSLLLATYVPVTFAAIAIIYLEYSSPARREWLPHRNEVSTDATYMVLAQILLPRILGFAVSLFLLNILRLDNASTLSFWPSELPVVVQSMLMLLIADFFRYWLHRLSHNWNPLWQLHAVHHSPHKLYWLNVNRFHPIEKIIQYLFDVLPFLLIGISEEVLALYFVFYAINGFFQHCNINIRMGVLNLLISGPELHRWHHSEKIEESNTNYGNNLIVWDLLFGTWFLPRTKNVDRLGLINRDYPMDFISQLKSPFVIGLDKNL